MDLSFITRERPTVIRHSPAPTRIVHVLLSLDPGGLERVVLDLVRQAPSLGQNVAVVCLERPGRLAPDAEECGASVYCVHKPPGLRPGLVPSLTRLLRELRPHVVHTHQIGVLLYAGPAARLAGVPAVVHTEHGKHYARRRTRWLGRLAALTADRFFCVSSDIAAEVAARCVVPKRKLCVVANGIDTWRFASSSDRAALRQSWNIPASALVIGTVGRLAEVKRQDVLLAAFARVRKQRPDAHLLLVGDGPLRDLLRQLAERLDVARFVHFAGYQPHPEQFLQGMDVFALTSRSEGMPLAVLEAWAAGVPVVASRVGGLPEMVNDQIGVLFPPGDEAALARALESLLTNPVRARHLAEAAQAHVRAEYDVGGMVETYQRHYRELLGSVGVAP
ncbi:MAG: glycosyltransferase [Gemmataceae bacterium]|nr:glycosyltransferase [Gemmataceae bacterium]